MSNRKQKLIIGVCAPVAAVSLAAGTTALVVGINHHQSSESFIEKKNVVFKTSEGHFQNNNASVDVEAGTTLDRVAQPQVILPKGKMFTGWVDNDGAPVYGQYAIRDDITLHANSDELTSDYVVVKFQAPSTPSSVVLQGNLTVAVKKGYYFYMINRPSASATDESGRNYYFKNWAYAKACGTHAAGDIVQENDEITLDAVLEPVFTKAVTVTWDLNGGTLLRGSLSTTQESGSTFAKFNQPGIDNGDQYFENWYDELPPESPTETWLAEHVISDAKEITGDLTAYARWIQTPTPTEKYVAVKYDVEPIEGKTFVITPSADVLVEKGTPFAKVNRPTIVETTKNDYKVNYWLYRTSSEAEWQKLTDETQITVNNTQIRAVMVESVDSVIATADDTNPLPEQNIECHAVVYGGVETQTVQWGIYSDKECTTKLDTSIATIDPNTGIVLTKSVEESSTFYVQATSTLTLGWTTPKKSDPIKFTIKLPYTDSSYIWYHEKLSETDNKWYYFTQDQLCNTSLTELKPKDINNVERTTSWDKTTSFTYPLYFGDQIQMVKPNFMQGWSGFNGELKLGSSNIAWLTSNFLADCTSFNNGGQPLVLDNIAYIADDFLSGCTSFNLPIDFSKNSTIYEIGDNFMQGCTSFNSAITFPSQALTINNNFLFKCSSFNQNITFPSTISYVGNYCMNGCDDFTSTITVECPVSVFTGKQFDFVANNSDAAIYKTGFKVAGTYKTDFEAKFPTLADKTYSVYRTIQDSSKPSETDWTAAKATLNNFTSATVQHTTSDGKVDTTFYINKNNTADQAREKVVDNSANTSYYTHDLSIGSVNCTATYDMNGYINEFESYQSYRYLKTIDQAIEPINNNEYSDFEYDSINEQFVKDDSWVTYYVKLDPTTQTFTSISSKYTYDENIETYSFSDFNNTTLGTEPTYETPIIVNNAGSTSTTFDSGEFTPRLDNPQWIAIPYGYISSPLAKSVSFTLVDADGNKIGLSPFKWAVMHESGGYVNSRGSDESYIAGTGQDTGVLFYNDSEWVENDILLFQPIYKTLPSGNVHIANGQLGAYNSGHIGAYSENLSQYSTILDLGNIGSYTISTDGNQTYLTVPSTQSAALTIKITMENAYTVKPSLIRTAGQNSHIYWGDNQDWVSLDEASLSAKGITLTEPGYTSETDIYYTITIPQNVADQFRGIWVEWEPSA